MLRLVSVLLPRASRALRGQKQAVGLEGTCMLGLLSSCWHAHLLEHSVVSIVSI